MRLVNVERRYSSQLGSLPDKSEREAMRPGWTVVVINHETNAEITLRIVDVRGDDAYTGTMSIVGGVTSIHFDSSNVLRISSRLERARA